MYVTIPSKWQSFVQSLRNAWTILPWTFFMVVLSIAIIGWINQPTTIFGLNPRIREVENAWVKINAPLGGVTIEAGAANSFTFRQGEVVEVARSITPQVGYPYDEYWHFQRNLRSVSYFSLEGRGVDVQVLSQMPVVIQYGPLPAEALQNSVITAFIAGIIWFLVTLILWVSGNSTSEPY